VLLTLFHMPKTLYFIKVTCGWFRNIDHLRKSLVSFSSVSLLVLLFNKIEQWNLSIHFQFYWVFHPDVNTCWVLWINEYFMGFLEIFPKYFLKFLCFFAFATWLPFYKNFLKYTRSLVIVHLCGYNKIS
jgi:hypothetical protein